MSDKTQVLTSLQNIGKTLADKLILVGIETPEHLFEAGSENVFIKLATIDKNACINQLYALEGAIQGIRWHDLSHERKYELLEFYKTVK